jgi:phosphoglycerate dehydrogenase-like enzyme
VKLLLMYEPSAAHRADLEQAAPGACFRVAPSEEQAAELIRDADAVLGNRYFLQSLPHARHLRWMQSNSMGVDRLFGAGAALRNVTVTCARGLYANEIAEHGIALLLALLRGLHHARDAQHAGVWRREPLRRLGGSRVLLMGWGSVGHAIARRLHAFGARVDVVRRTHAGPPAENEWGQLVHGPEQWRDRLPITDAVIMTLPITTATANIIGEQEIAALPEHAVLVNVGRGGTVDEEALVRALVNDRLAGAALDVLEREPPDAGDAVWSLPNLLLTPHVARSPERPPFRWEPLFVENVRRFAHGEPLLNVVDPAVGY